MERAAKVGITYCLGLQHGPAHDEMTRHLTHTARQHLLPTLLGPLSQWQASHALMPLERIVVRHSMA